MCRACVSGIQQGIGGTTSIKQFRMSRLHERDGDIVVLLSLFLHYTISFRLLRVS